MTVTQMLDGGTDRRRGEPQQDLLERDGCAHPRARARHARARSGAHERRRTNDGSTASCSRSRARSTRARTRSNATSSPTASCNCRGPLMRFAFTDDQQLSPRVSATSLPRSAHRRTCAPRGRTARATTPTLWSHLGEMGVLGVLVPEHQGGFRGYRRRPRAVARAAGQGGGARPGRRDTAVVMPALAGTEWAAGHRRRVGDRHRCARRFAVRAARAGGRHRPEARGEWRVPRASTLTDVDGIDRVAESSPSTARPSNQSRSTPTSRSTAARCVRRVPRGALGPHDRRCRRVRAGNVSSTASPSASFQAVKHLLADALQKVEFAKPAVYRAAWSISADEPTRARRLDGEGIRELTPRTVPVAARCRCTVRSATRGKPISSSG